MCEEEEVVQSKLRLLHPPGGEGKADPDNNNWIGGWWI